MRVRWMIRNDLDRVMQIQEASHFECLDRQEFRRWLRERNVIGVVLEHPDLYGDNHFPLLTAYALYEVNRESVEIRHLRVHPVYEWQGCGRTLVEYMKRRLNESRNVIRVCVSEQETGSHLFLKACGFRATQVDRGWKEGECGYRFEYRVKVGICVGR
jgi:ribosomal-protein-alanine N-acetyltransferase